MPRRRSFAAAGVSDGDLISLLRARPQAPAPGPPPAAQGVAMPARNADGSLADPQGFMRGLLANPGLMASIPPALADVIRRGDAASLNNYFRRACGKARGAAHPTQTHVVEEDATQLLPHLCKGCWTLPSIWG